MEPEPIAVLATAVMLIRRRIERESRRIVEDETRLTERDTQMRNLSKRLDALLAAGDRAGVIALALDC